MGTEELSVAVAAFALAAALAGLLVQAKIHRTNRAVPTVLQVILEYRSMAEDLRLVEASRKSFPTSIENPGWEGLETNLRASAWKVSSYFDHLGVLIAHRLVPQLALLGYFSHPIIDYWNLLAPVIEAERAKRGGGHQEYFEMLVDLCEKFPAEDIWKRRRRRLGLKPRAASSPWQRSADIDRLSH